MAETACIIVQQNIDGRVYWRSSETTIGGEGA
jgi:hypothetical protein